MMCLMMCACSNETVNPNDNQDINACDVLNPCDTTLSSADENLKWEKISLLESLDYAKETVILFYSFTDCPYCIEARPILEEVLEGSDIPVYYVDVAREERNVDNENYLAVYNHFKDKNGLIQYIYEIYIIPDFGDSTKDINFEISMLHTLQKMKEY